MQGLRPFFRYFEFSGRSGRAEYWQYIVLIFITLMLFALIEMKSLLESIAMGVPSIPIWSSVFALLTFIPTMAVTFRRLHDRNKSGWLIGGWYIAMAAAALVAAVAGLVFDEAPWPLLLAIYLALMVVGVYIVVQLALPGDEHENDFGAPDDLPFDIRERFGMAPAGSTPASRPRSASARPVEGEDPLARIERLADLHAKGHLTDEEFSSQKARLLDGLAR